MTSEQAREVKWGDKVRHQATKVKAIFCAIDPQDNIKMLVVTADGDIFRWPITSVEKVREPAVIYMNEEVHGFHGPFETPEEAEKALSSSGYNAAVKFVEVIEDE